MSNRRLQANTVDTSKIYSDINDTGYNAGDLAYDENGNLCIFLQYDGGTDTILGQKYGVGLINPATLQFQGYGNTDDNSRKVMSVGILPADLESTLTDNYYCWVLAESGRGS